jgi:hypothetical protein
VAEPENTESALVFHYIKSNSHRSVHVDGALASLSASGGLHVALFNERMPIPQQTVVGFVGDKQFDLPDRMVSRQGVVREVDVSLYLSLPVAKELMSLLGRQIEMAEKVAAEMKAL